MNDGRGELVYGGHECGPPPPAEFSAIWRCECGRYWELLDKWRPMSPFHAWIARLARRSR